MIVITGTGRCGTSFMAEFCRLLGMNIGPDPRWYPSLDAGNEDHKVILINEDLENQLRRSTTYAERLALRRRMRAVHYDAVKDPRFTNHLGMLSFWHTARPLRVLYLWRDPHAVFASRSLHLRFKAEVARLSPSILQARHESTLEELDNANIPHAVFEFPDVLGQFDEVFDFLTWESVSKRRAREIWNNLVDYDKVHV